MIGASLMVVPASGAPLAGDFSKDLMTQSAGNSQLIQVQGRAHRGGGHHDGRGHSGGGGDGAGAAAAGAAIGLFLGAIIASEAQRHQAIEYCMRRFRSYDPQSMTYLGRDGRRHRCP